MTLTQIRSTRLSSTSEALSDVHDPDCHLAIWERDTIAGLDSLLASQPSDVRFTAHLDSLEASLQNELTGSGFPDLPVREQLLADIRELARLYCSILTLDALEVRLEIVTTDSCRKWHSDYVSARLISTYVGTGTQWLDTEDAERVRLGAEPMRINTLSAGDVGIFKGRLATETPAIHRSPPIANTGATRLLLVLNPPEAH